MLDETVCHVGYTDLLLAEVIRYQVGYALIALRFDSGRSVCERFFHEGNEVSLGFVLVAFGVFLGGRFLTLSEIDEEVVRSGGVKQLFGETPLCWSGLESRTCPRKSSAMAISFRPISFHESRRDCDGPNAGLGAASFLAISWVCADKVRRLPVRISMQIKYAFFMASFSAIRDEFILTRLLEE
jgi:hypothetical protein